MAYENECIRVYTNSDGTGDRWSVWATYTPKLQNDIIVKSGSQPTSISGYRSAGYFVPQTSAGVFLIFEHSDQVYYYNNGNRTYPSPYYDDNSQLYGVAIESNVTSNSNYAETLVDIPIFDNRADWLEYITTPPTPLYTWQSVPSVSGKNGNCLPIGGFCLAVTDDHCKYLKEVENADSN